MAALRKIQVRLEVSADEPVTVALTQEDCSLLLSNLLLNALQHSPPESSVELRVASQREQNIVEFSVRDHGEGIDPADLPHVFDRFYRSDPSRTRSTGGAGLGLAICKAVVERAGGSIALTSQPGQGTTVTVRLPLRPDPDTTANPSSA